MQKNNKGNFISSLLNSVSNGANEIIIIKKETSYVPFNVTLNKTLKLSLRTLRYRILYLFYISSKENWKSQSGNAKFEFFKTYNY